MTYVTVVYIILAVLLVGGLGGFFVVAPLLERVDRRGKVGILGF